MDKDKVKILNQLIDDRVENFLGYGDFNSKIWFIGMEEGGLPMEDGKIKGKNAMDYYINLFETNKRKTFDDIENSDWQKAWGGKFHMLYRLSLYLENNKDVFHEYNKNFKSDFRKNFGKLKRDSKGFSNCFLEFNPIPFRKSSKGSFFWRYIAGKNYGEDVHNRESFLNYIRDKRLELLKDQLELCKPEIVIFYSKIYGDYLLPLANGNSKPIVIGDIIKNRKGKKIREKISISFFNYKRSKIFVIPHCSYHGMSLKLFEKIAEKIAKENS